MAILKDEVSSSAAPLLVARCALKDQMTQELMKQAQQYAQTRVTLVRRGTKPVSKSYARELVEDAYADTWTGDLPWDPSQCSLLVHLCQAIRQRTWMEIRHTRRVPLVSLHGSAFDGATSRQFEHVLVQSSNGDCRPMILCAISAIVCRELRALVPHGRDGRMDIVLLQCWEDGFISRDEVIKRTGITKITYKRARKRLLYLSRCLTPALRDLVLDLLRSPHE